MWSKIKEQWDENPIAVIAVAGFSLTAVAKLIDSVSAARSRSAYARGVDYRVNR